jgi:enoyl-CoA hydratase/carnithine racemase
MAISELTMPSSRLTTERRGAIATVTLGAENEQLARRLTDLDDDASIHVIVIDGAQTTGAVPGGAAAAVAMLVTPSIAAIVGECLDERLELSLASDVRVASRAARFGMRQVADGRLPRQGGTQRLTHAVGRAHALRLLLTSDVIGADEALRIGLVQAVVPASRLATAVAALAERIASAAPIAAAYAKEAVAAGSDLTLAQGLALEHDLGVLLHSTDDRAEGLRAFAERRAAAYRGR